MQVTIYRSGSKYVVVPENTAFDTLPVEVQAFLGTNVSKRNQRIQPTDSLLAADPAAAIKDIEEKGYHVGQAKVEFSASVK